MVDLHSHTNASDGSDSPAQLVDNALAAGVQTLSITDHDTLAGYREALPYAVQKGLDLLCGIELSTKYEGKTVHLLGYFPHQEPSEAFQTWLIDLGLKRRDRNVRLVANLQKAGVDITLAEVEALGKTMAGRPHFASILLQKKYVKTMQEAFDKYLAETGRAFTEREEVPLDEGIERMREAGGIPVMAHPVRLGRRTAEEEAEWIAAAKDMGMLGLEVRHSDHDAAAITRYTALAERLGLLTTGGSDYHGTYKPDIRLGTGKNGNVNVPAEWVSRLRAV
ncbi:MAG TPA: PHP domain-containing protein [Bryobacteraceae bacterium]|nr:PHP domain-containing protein [Bryobacteraceae bacterium]